MVVRILSRSGRVVAYLRCSSDRQAEASIPAQRRAIAELAARKGYVIAEWFIDEGISGDAPEARPEFLRLRAAAEAGQIARVLLWDQDRLLRTDLLESGFWLHPFRKAGVVLETVTSGVVPWDDFASRIVFAVSQEGKHQFLRDLSRNVSRGSLACVRAGKRPGGPKPYGYLVVEQRLTPHPVEGPIVQRIFRDYAAGSTLRAIALALNREEVPSPRGLRWAVSTLRLILCKPLYLGKLTWGQNSNSKYHRIVNGVAVPLNQADAPTPEVVPGAHDSLIDQTIFDQVQDRLQTNKATAALHQPGPGRGNPLTGLVVCSACGLKMDAAKHDYRRADSPSVFRCASNQQGAGTCGSNCVRADRLLHCVCRKLREFWGSPENLAKLRKAVEDELKTDQRPKDRDRLADRIAELDRTIERGNSRLLTSSDSVYAALVKQLEEAQREREQVQAQLASMDRQQEPLDVAIMADAALTQMDRLETVLRSEPVAVVREVLGGLVERVELDFRRVPTGDRRCKNGLRSEFAGGFIHLRPPLAEKCKGAVHYGVPTARDIQVANLTRTSPC